MDLMWFVYLADILPNLGSFLTVISAIAGVVTAVMLFPGILIIAECNKGDMTKIKNIYQAVYWKSIPVFLIAGILSNVVPETKTMYLMAAAKGVETVAANPQVQSIATNSLKLLERQIQKYMDEEMKDEKKNDTSN